MIKLNGIDEISKRDFILWNFATNSLLVNADKEYILSRKSYWLDYDIQFLWLANQAVEKYLKAILLYNAISIKSIEHKLVCALDKVQAIKNFNFNLPDESLDFIKFLHKQGQNRYFDRPFEIPRNALLILDKTIWGIRRYCDNYHYDRYTFDVRINEDIFIARIKELSDDEVISNPLKFKLNHGYLETVIGKNKKDKEDLVYKNFYYGQKRKKRLKNYRNRYSLGSPTNMNYEEAYEILNKYVDHLPKNMV
jgi:hypothetical protein